MSELWNILQGSYYNVKGILSLSKFLNIIGGDTNSSAMFTEFQDLSHPKSETWNR